MLISPAMNTKLNEQIGNEFGASQAYLAMACQFDNLGLKRLAKRFRKQCDEERRHALKIVDYILDVGGKVTLPPLPPPQAEFVSVLAAIEAAVGHEKRVTQQIHDLVNLAESQKDHATRSFLQWFVDEQVEEVKTMELLAQVARMAGPNLLQLETWIATTDDADD